MTDNDHETPLLSKADHEVIQLRREIDALHESVDLLTDSLTYLLSEIGILKQKENNSHAASSLE